MVEQVLSTIDTYYEHTGHNRTSVTIYNDGDDVLLYEKSEPTHIHKNLLHAVEVASQQLGAALYWVEHSEKLDRLVIRVY
jgi:hypothetical protein